MTLDELLASVAAAIDDVVAASTADGGRTWAVGPDPFAVLGADGRSVEFRLDLAIAAAAVRTPDTGPSPRGQGWVRFQPSTLDGHAIDRATAWFVSAYRRTSPG